ncbi:MAG: hypothetical protein RL630_469 [Verrucomicrobiota bacterium]|jgi:hypothetical protein
MIVRFRKTKRWLSRGMVVLLPLALMSSCETIDHEAPARAAMAAAIRAEQPGNYFVGRRMFKKDYKMWGWVRDPGQPWKSARLVMLNEQTLLAPDRVRGTLGDDNNHEYRLEGRFTGETIYEPASDRFYPEFQLTGFKLVNSQPPPIYVDKRQEDPAIRIIMAPAH